MTKGKEQFIYILKLIPYLLDETNWSNKEEEIVNRHFSALQNLLKEGILILAGRTLNMDEKTFGIVILEVESEEEARNIMESDPAVAEGVMTAELFPYKVALMRNSNDFLKPGYLTKNGEGDLVVMSLEAYSQREKMLDLREKLLEAEISMASGNRTYSLEEVSKKLEELINDRK